MSPGRTTQGGQHQQNSSTLVVAAPLLQPADSLAGVVDRSFVFRDCGCGGCGGEPRRRRSGAGGVDRAAQALRGGPGLPRQGGGVGDAAVVPPFIFVDGPFPEDRFDGNSAAARRSNSRRRMSRMFKRGRPKDPPGQPPPPPPPPPPDDDDAGGGGGTPPPPAAAATAAPSSNTSVIPELDLHGYVKSAALRRAGEFLECHRTDGINKSWVRIVTGSGRHSSDAGGPILKMAIRKSLERRGMEFVQDGPGAFLVDAASGNLLYEDDSEGTDSKVVVVSREEFDRANGGSSGGVAAAAAAATATSTSSGGTATLNDAPPGSRRSSASSSRLRAAPVTAAAAAAVHEADTAPSARAAATYSSYRRANGDEDNSGSINSNNGRAAGADPDWQRNHVGFSEVVGGAARGSPPVSPLSEEERELVASCERAGNPGPSVTEIADLEKRQRETIRMMDQARYESLNEYQKQEADLDEEARALREALKKSMEETSGPKSEEAMKEEEMLRQAIEASRAEQERRKMQQQEDPGRLEEELKAAVRLSLKTSEEEKAKEEKLLRQAIELSQREQQKEREDGDDEDLIRKAIELSTMHEEEERRRAQADEAETLRLALELSAREEEQQRLEEERLLRKILAESSRGQQQHLNQHQQSSSTFASTNLDLDEECKEELVEPSPSELEIDPYNIGHIDRYRDDDDDDDDDEEEHVNRAVPLGAVPGN